MSIFDGLQDTMFNVVNNTMGSPAIWTPSNTNVPTTAIVLFKDATATAKMLDQVYSPENCMIEYKEGDLPGLKQLADSGAEETIVVNGITYGVMKVTSKWDGKSYFAHLTQV